MSNWYMLTLVGADKPGIVANITKTLYEADCNLGEASMNRLGGNFTVMVMINTEHSENAVKEKLALPCKDQELHFHIDKIEGKLHNHHVPDISIIVSGADHAGIVAQVTNALYDAGLDILDLNSDVAGSEDKPIYICQIDGQAQDGIKALEAAIIPLREKGIDISLREIETMVG